ERFFRSRGAPVTIDLCPLASPELLESLCRRGYRPQEFNNVMVRWLAGASPGPGAGRVERSCDMELWSQVVGAGFFEQPDLSEEERDVGGAVFRSGSAECYLAFTPQGEPGAGAALSIREGTAVLFADGTVPCYRRLGLQLALIHRRVSDAIDRG